MCLRSTCRHNPSLGSDRRLQVPCSHGPGATDLLNPSTREREVRELGWENLTARDPHHDDHRETRRSRRSPEPVIKSWICLVPSIRLTVSRFLPYSRLRGVDIRTKGHASQIAGIRVYSSGLFVLPLLVVRSIVCPAADMRDDRTTGQGLQLTRECICSGSEKDIPVLVLLPVDVVRHSQPHLLLYPPILTSSSRIAVSLITKCLVFSRKQTFFMCIRAIKP